MHYTHRKITKTLLPRSSSFSPTTVEELRGGGLQETMSTGAKGGAAARTRVSIPSSVKKTIENIKEITGHNHGEDEIYAMLKECSMDPNETAQKLLLLDAFHEVKKRRDRRRENLKPAHSRWIQGSQAQMNRVGRGNYSSRPLFHDAGGGKISSAVKENVLGHILEKVVDSATLCNTQPIINNKASSVSSPITDISNRPSGVSSHSANCKKDDNAWASGSINKFNRTKNGSVCKLEESLPLPSPVYSNKNMGAPGPRDTQQNEMLDSSDSSISVSSISASGSQFISLDPLPSPSQDFPFQSALDSIRNEVGTNHILVERNSDNHSERNMVSNVPQKTLSDFSGGEKEQHLATMQTALSRPSSDDNIRPQVIAPLSQNVIPGKEWKPKSTNSSIGQATSAAVSYEGSAISIGSQPESQQTPLEKATSELQRKLEELHASNTQQVVLPNHIHVPEAGKVGFCFGSFESFDASFGLQLTQDGHGGDKSTPFSESSNIGEPTEVLQLSNPAVSVAGGDTEIIYLDHTPSVSQQPEESSREAEVLSSDTYDYVESKQKVSPEGHQHPVMNTSSSYNYGYVPPMLNGQLRPSDVSESQARGILPGFLQPFDPTGYYAQFGRPGMESDGCSLPLNSAGAANKYNGNVGLISAQTSQSPQEDSVMSTASVVPLVTQAVGLQSSISANMQHLPVFRHPTGIHLPHYSPFIHYAPYFSPIYVPPHGIHPYFSSGTFPQQPHGGNLYLNPYMATANYPIPQNEQGSNAQSADHNGVPVSYATHRVPPANYTATPVTEALNSTSNEEVKENNMCANEQQIEGADVCQVQMAFASAQPALGTYTGVFHPGHTVTSATVHPLLLQQSQPITVPIDMIGQTTGVYPPQLQQHTQLNWPSNY